jgi:hypothetical protein
MKRNQMERNKTAITLDDLEERRLKVLDDIHHQEKKIRTICNDAFAPLKPAVTFSEGLSRIINSTFSLYQGLRIGYKLVSLLGWRKGKFSK